VSTGSTHSCALDGTGKAYCWGQGTLGQLGSGVVAVRSTPFPVSGGHTFTAIDVGVMYTCALTPTGQAYCWGSNPAGQLGNGSTTNQSTPVPVSGGLTFASISVGSNHTCALTAAGQAHCWGNGVALGNGSPTHRSTPVAVSGGLTFASISAGNRHTGGITTAGQAYCWGENRGQLGDGTFTGALVLAPTAVVGGLTFASISAGTEHTCGLTTTGAAYCWGSGQNGRLGIGLSGAVRTSPAAVSGGLVFASISASVHTCAITTAEQAYCWGSNSRGQLGVNRTELRDFDFRSIPVAVSGDLAFASVSVGFMHSCGVTTGRDAYCWGAASGGRLGNGQTADLIYFTPVPVAEFP